MKTILIWLVFPWFWKTHITFYWWIETFNCSLLIVVWPILIVFFVDYHGQGSSDNPPPCFSTRHPVDYLPSFLSLWNTLLPFCRSFYVTRRAVNDISMYKTSSYYRLWSQTHFTRSFKVHVTHSNFNLVPQESLTA